jgi:hypothetical protein
MSEVETINALIDGHSLSRFGDGELKCAEGFGYCSQPPNQKMAKELRGIMRESTAICAIPTMDKNGPRVEWWERHRDRFLKHLSMGRVYGSAFIGIPVLAPWIDTKEYADLVSQIWAGKDVIAVCHKDHSMPNMLAQRAKSVRHVECPAIDAYAAIDELEAQCDALTIIAAGPTATCLANRLAKKVQAIDLGRCSGLVERHHA